jgi:P27 family predicted phage terminase small subunit
MVKPSKSANLMSKKLTKAEKQKRLENEDNLKGDSNSIAPPKHLNANQKKLFNYVVDELRASGILGNLDVFILELFAIATDRLQAIEKSINKNFQLIYDKGLMASKSKYTTDLVTAINQLSLSPQSRAKLSGLNLKAQADAEDPLLQVLKGGKE